MAFSIDVRVTIDNIEEVLPEDIIQFSRYAIQGASVFNGGNTTVTLLRMGEEKPSRPSDLELSMMKRLSQGNCPQTPNENADSSQESPDERAEKPFQEGERVVTKDGHGVRDWEDLNQRHRDGGSRI